MKRIELYSADEAERLRRKNKTWTVITAAFAALVLAACVTLCFLTGTANAAQMEPAVCIVSAAGGCVVIFIYVHFVSAGRRMERHIRTLQDEEPRAVTGLAYLDAARISIPGSITVQTIRIKCDEPAAEEDGTIPDPNRKRREHASVSASKARLLPPLPAHLTIYTVHGYVTAYETEEN